MAVIFSGRCSVTFRTRDAAREGQRRRIRIGSSVYAASYFRRYGRTPLNIGRVSAADAQDQAKCQ